MASSDSANRVIFFDWGGVFTLARRSTNPTLRLEMQLGITAGSLSKRLYDNVHWSRAQIGEITDEEFWQLTLRQFNILDKSEIATFKAALFKGESARLRLGMVDLVKKLKRRYTVALISNADDLFRTLLKTKFHADQLFHHAIISAEVGIAKPDPRIFQLACRIVEAKETNCVFVDDSLVNVESAASVGIQSIQFTTTVSLKRDLRQIGLVF